MAYKQNQSGQAGPCSMWGAPHHWRHVSRERPKTICPAVLSTSRSNFLPQLSHCVTLGKSCHLWTFIFLSVKWL